MNLFDNVHQEMKKLIPTSLVGEIACFVFHDKHPKDEKNVDITVCTKSGELSEYFQRDLQCRLDLSRVLKNLPSDLRIARNNNSELFYLLSTKDELFIISSRNTLQVHRKLTNIDRYDFNDTACSGETFLKVLWKDDAVPLIFDSNFECLLDRDVIPNTQKTEDSFPILSELERKLVEARYSTKCNEKTYAHYLNLHQRVALLSYQNQQPPANSTVFQDNFKKISQALKLKTHKPRVKVCNEKIVIMFNVLIECQEPVENIHILLRSSIPFLVYTTKKFTKVSSTPYWEEAHSNTLKPGQECVIVAVVNLDEFKQNVSSRIELSGSIAYELSKQEYLISFEDVVVSSMEVMGDELDVLSSCRTDDQNSIIIAVLAATEKTELCFRHIKKDNEPDVSLLDLFCTYLQMDRVENTSNVVVYRKSPYHALNGTMLIFHERNSDNAVPVSVHTRSSSQVLALLNCIYDAIPAKIIATTAAYKITSKTDDLSHYNEYISNTTKTPNSTNYAKSMLNRSTKILEHLDSSMIKMNESRDPSVQSKVGTHIDLFAGGVGNFKKFRESMMKEAKEGLDSLKSESVNEENSLFLEDSEQGVDSLIKSDSLDNTGSDVMYID